jgi:MoaA/NifB/PqqE/SkfB family radical SAM enzyme
MTVPDWKRVIDEAAQLDVRTLQFIGGEATLHPALTELIGYALAQGLQVEVYSNLVHVTDDQWTAFQQDGVTLACSYYSDDAAQHDAITGRPSHARTRANILEAVRRGIDIRVGVIGVHDDQRVEQAHAELVTLGVTKVGGDHLRRLGRGAAGQLGCATELCGQCGSGVAMVGPDGQVKPCPLARWQTVGSVLTQPLSDLVGQIPAARAALIVQGMPTVSISDCGPDGNPCYPLDCQPR